MPLLFFGGHSNPSAWPHGVIIFFVGGSSHEWVNFARGEKEDRRREKYKFLEVQLANEKFLQEQKNKGRG